MSNKINLANERRARLAAERILQIKQAELYSVNCNLSQRTKDLNQEITKLVLKLIMFWTKIYELKLIYQPQINVFELRNDGFIIR